MLIKPPLEDISTRITQDILDNTPVTSLGIGSTAGALVDVTARELSRLYNYVDSVRQGAYLSTAGGDSLDRLGGLFGLTRRRATRGYSSNYNFRFFIDPRYGGHTVSDLVKIANDAGSSIREIKIKAGTLVSTPDGSIAYVTNSDAILTNSGSYVSVTSTGAGGEYNVGVGALTRHNIAENQQELASIAKYIACSNAEEPIGNAGNYESDNDFRARIAEARSAMKTGNLAAVKWAALNVPGVADVSIVPAVEGPGTFEVVLTTDYAIPSQAVLLAVNQEIEKTAPCGSRAIVSTPELLAIELKVSLDFHSSVSRENRDLIKSTVRTRVIDYVNNLPVGGTFVVNECIQRVMETDPGIRDMKQEYFRISTYSKKMGILPSTKAQTRSSVDVFKEVESGTVVWSNQSCKEYNPPQKFIMLGKHLVVC